MRWINLAFNVLVVILVPVFIWQSYTLLDTYRRLAEDVNGLADQLEIVEALSSDAMNSSSTALSAMKTVLDQVERLQRVVDALTTVEISNRLTETDKAIERLSGKLDVFEQIINPDAAQDILNVARLRRRLLRVRVLRTKSESL